VITMDDKPLLAIRRKKDSSMMRAIELVKNGEAVAAVSCAIPAAWWQRPFSSSAPLKGLIAPPWPRLCLAPTGIYSSRRRRQPGRPL